MNKLVFYPDDPRTYKERTYKKFRPKRESWHAPEHAKGLMEMKRDRKGNLILDNRPNIMRPDIRPNPLMVMSSEICY